MSSAETFTQLLRSEESPSTDDQSKGDAESGSALHSLIRQISSSSQQSLQSPKEEEGGVQGNEEKPAAVEAEQNAQGSVSASVYKRYWLLGASPFFLGFLVSLFALAQISASGADFWVAFWTTTEQKRFSQNYYKAAQMNNTNSTGPIEGTR